MEITNANYTDVMMILEPIIEDLDAPALNSQWHGVGFSINGESVAQVEVRVGTAAKIL